MGGTADALAAVFPDAAPPAELTTLVDTHDGAAAARALTGRRWHELTVADVDAIRGALLVLTPAAFLHYLPAFVVAAKESARYGADHAGHVVLALNAPHALDGVARARWHATRGARLADAQRRVIAELLETKLRPLPAAAVDGGEPWESLARMRDAIRRAFPAAPIPAGVAIAPGGPEGEPWTAASLGELADARSAIHFLLPAAFAYYLPAYLLGILDPSPLGTEISAAVTFALGDLVVQRGTEEVCTARWHALAPAQRHVVADAFLELARRAPRLHQDEAEVGARWRAEADSAT